MPRSTGQPKDTSFNFRIDPALKDSFTKAAEAADRPAAQVLREFMRRYVAQRERALFDRDAGRQARTVAETAHNPESDTAAALRELDTLLDEDEFAAEWKA